MRDQYGFSLLELLTSIAIIGILTSLALPSLNTLKDKVVADKTTHHILAILNFARHHAVTLKAPTVVCPSNNQRQCQSNWQRAWIVFEDDNTNGILDDDERLLRSYDNLLRDETLVLRAFGSRSRIQFDAFGGTGYQNGRFYYCSADKTEKRQLILFRTGRTRIAKDSSLRDSCG